jgi:uncharacterized protein YlaN (UPF0358 family)
MNTLEKQINIIDDLTVKMEMIMTGNRVITVNKTCPKCQTNYPFWDITMCDGFNLEQGIHYTCRAQINDEECGSTMVFNPLTKEEVIAVLKEKKAKRSL